MNRYRKAWDKKAQQHFVKPADYDEVVKAIGVYGGVEKFRELGRRDVEEAVRRLLEKGFGVGGQRALDLGCGIGRTAGLFAECFGEVYGCDISPMMIGEAKELWISTPNIHFDVCSGLDLSIYPDEFFDFVYSNGMFEHLRKATELAYIREIARVLKVRGWFALEFNSRRWLPSRFPVVHRSIYNFLLETGILGKAIAPLYLRSGWAGDLLGFLPSRGFLLKAFSASRLNVTDFVGEDAGIMWFYGERLE